MDATSSRQCYTREDIIARLDGDGDLEIDEDNLEDIFHPGSMGVKVKDFTIQSDAKD